ncbi:MAG: hypothetical protein HS129_15255 [Leptospiraceae bacterium]|nr:hypothetical protein [Leptospiraceae bacterium]NUM40828.1 hypothetical protein [Leptospiraceae bacterium]
MNKIKFSHTYMKLFEYDEIPVKEAQLLEVLNIELEKLSGYFITYDTIFWDEGEMHPDLYPLPEKGDYLLLIFEKISAPNRDIFTTLRRYTQEKEKYYRDSIGKVFDVVIQKGIHDK